MTIGYVNPEYNTRRNIVNADKNARYVRVRSYGGMADKILGSTRIGRKLLRDAGFAYFGGVGDRRADLMHFWDKIAVWPCRKKYITTFEDILPRYMGEGKLFHLGLESMLSDRCRRLIAFSQCARDHQVRYDAKLGISELDNKIAVLLPPQKTLVSADDVRKRETKDVLRFVFIGKAFFRKGGMCACRALREMRQDGANIELYLIANIDYFDYAASTEYDDVAQAHRFVDENRDWIHYHQFMPNDQVLELLKTCHVGLLPTRDDTFGYSVLEMQAAGLPCITTDIWSLPEVNNADCGWVIPLPKNELRQANYFTVDGLRDIDQRIERGIKLACRQIFSNRESIVEKGVQSLARIKTSHSPEEFSNRIHRIYEEALG